MRAFRISFIGWILFCSVATAKQTTKQIEILPSKVHEECFSLRTHQTLNYSYKADTGLDFNIHYHQGKGVFYPVQWIGKSAHKATFKPKFNQEYCLMWTNKTGSAVIVDYQFQIAD